MASKNSVGALFAHGNIPGTKRDVFFEAYMFMEVAASDTPFWLDKNSNLTLED